MRARMALKVSEIEFEHRDILLKDKPPEMLKASSKGTVPVVVLPDGNVLEESLDIMYWALGQNDPEGWLLAEKATTEALIVQNDTIFKHNLDRFKYPTRYPDEDCSNAEKNCYDILEKLEKQLAGKAYLFGDRRTLADIAIFPFIRQFSFVDIEKFKSKNLPHLQKWRDSLLNSDLFKDIMVKRDLWVSPNTNSGQQP